jgi:hypothetical protein
VPIATTATTKNAVAIFFVQFFKKLFIQLPFLNYLLNNPLSITLPSLTYQVALPNKADSKAGGTTYNFFIFFPFLI